MLETYETHLVQAFGSPIYMAPETLANKPYDFKVDIWSLGVTLYEAITGKYLYQGQSRIQIFNKIISSPFFIDSNS